jgi:uncharacterized protein (TIGR03067 family)
MIRPGLLLGLVGLLGLTFLAAALAGGEPVKPKKEVKVKFPGTWKVVSAEVNGKELGEGIKRTRWVMTDTTFTAKLPQEGKGEFAYQAGEAARRGTKAGEAARRGTIDIEVLRSEIVRDGGPRKRVYLGIYSVEGDRLRICYAPVGKDRPTALATTPGSGDTLFVLERE